MWHTMLLLKNCKVNSVTSFSWLLPNTANNAAIHLQTLRCCVEREKYVLVTHLWSHMNLTFEGLHFPWYSLVTKHLPWLILLLCDDNSLRSVERSFFICFMLDCLIGCVWAWRIIRRLRKCKHFSKEPFRLEMIVWRLQMNNIWDSSQAQLEEERVNRVSLLKSNGRRLYVGNRVWIRLQCDEKKARAEEKRETRRRRGACVTHSHTEWAFEMHGRASS